MARPRIDIRYVLNGTVRAERATDSAVARRPPIHLPRRPGDDPGFRGDDHHLIFGFEVRLVEEGEQPVRGVRLRAGYYRYSRPSSLSVK